MTIDRRTQHNHQGKSKRSPRPRSSLMGPPQNAATVMLRAQEAPHTLTAGDVLQLQRTLGNQVVQRILAGRQRNGVQKDPTGTPAGTPTIQRVLFKENKLHATADYWDTKIAWGQGGYAETRKTTSNDPTFKNLIEGENTTQIKKYIKDATGLEVHNIASYTKDNPGAQSAIMAAKFLNQSDFTYEGGQQLLRQTANNLKAALFDHGQVVTPPAYADKFYGPDEVDAASKLILKPKDIIPETPDLPGSSASISKFKGEERSPWTLVCSLIALVKLEGIEKVKEKVSNNALNNEVAAVQALHNHYKGKGIEYDDTSTHPALYKEWGYKMIFSGSANFNNLHKYLQLKKNETLLFDIEGHTVKIKVKEDLPAYDANAQPTIVPGNYFERYSDPDNYGKDEFEQNVEYIYQK